MNKHKIKLKEIKKLKSGPKKFEAIFEKNNKIIKRKFGAAGMSDFTIHKDTSRRNNYIKRHTKDLRTNDPTRAGYLSMYILWNKKTFKASLADYKRRLNKYNKTGKFPLKVTGSSLNKFGLINEDFNFNFGKIPDNVKNKKLYSSIKAKIKKQVNKKGRRWGAYDSGRLVQEYKKAGGKYSGTKKTSQKSKLSRWYREKWIDACKWPKKKSCGRTKKEIDNKVTYCRPSVRINSSTPKLVQELSKETIKKRCEKKKKSPKKIVR